MNNTDDIIDLMSNTSYQHSPPGNNKPTSVITLENLIHPSKHNNGSITTSTTALSEEEEDEYQTDIVLSPKIKLLFTILGMGTLCPYNTIVSCIDWFQFYLQKEDHSLEGQISTSCISSLVLTTIILLFQQSKLSSNQRMYIGFTMDILLLSIFVVSKPSHSSLVMLSFWIGIADAISQSGVYGNAAGIHPQCSAYASLGSALSGAVVSFLRMICMSVTEEEQRGIILFFGIVVLFLCGCLYASTTLTVLEQHVQLKEQSCHRSSFHDVEESNVVQILPVSTPPSQWEVFLQVKHILFCMAFNFFVTLSLFPGVITSIPSMDHVISSDYMLICFKLTLTFKILYYLTNNIIFALYKSIFEFLNLICLHTFLKIT